MFEEYAETFSRPVKRLKRFGSVRTHFMSC